MAATRLRITFLYDLGDRVRWDRSTSMVYRVVWRRWHQGEASTWVEYGLVRADEPRLAHQIWRAYEPDLEAVEETP